MPEQPPYGKELAYYYSIAQVGLEMVVPIGLGLLIDYRFGSLPWATVIGAVLGFVLGLLHLIKLLNRRQDSSSSGKDREPR
jgi:F0F1-type ATP synthase assembly protein I